MTKPLFRKGLSMMDLLLLVQMPKDGCIILFNAKHRNVRTKARLLEYAVHNLNPRNRGEGESSPVQDLYLVPRPR